MNRDTIVSGILDALRNGPSTRDQLREILNDPAVDCYPELLGRALQWAKSEGLIEYSKVDGDCRHYWRLVQRTPAQKLGPVKAAHILQVAAHHELTTFDLYRAHDHGFADGQQHAFQIVADRIRALIAENAKIGCSPSIDELSDMATEIESGAWADESDES